MLCSIETVVASVGTIRIQVESDFPIVPSLWNAVKYDQIELGNAVHYTLATGTLEADTVDQTHDRNNDVL